MGICILVPKLVIAAISLQRDSLRLWERDFIISRTLTRYFGLSSKTARGEQKQLSSPFVYLISNGRAYQSDSLLILLL